MPLVGNGQNPISRQMLISGEKRVRDFNPLVSGIDATAAQKLGMFSRVYACCFMGLIVV